MKFVRGVRRSHGNFLWITFVHIHISISLTLSFLLLRIRGLRIYAPANPHHLHINTSSKRWHIKPLKLFHTRLSVTAPFK